MLVACSNETKNGVVETSLGINNFTKIDSDVTLSYASSDDVDTDVAAINETSDDVVLLPENISGRLLDDNYNDIREIPILPNLKPGWLWDTDGPIILSTKADTSLDDSLFIGAKIFADIVVFNGSLIQVESGFNVDILFDNQKVYEIQFTGPTPGAAFRRSIDAMTDVIASLDVETIYDVPLLMMEEGLDTVVLEKLKLPVAEKPLLNTWKNFLSKLKNPFLINSEIALFSYRKTCTFSEK